jgi:hypothetical protein
MSRGGKRTPGPGKSIGRRSKGPREQIGLRLSPESAALLRRICAERGLSQSEWVECMVEQWGAKKEG